MSEENWDDPNQQKAAFKNPPDSFALKPEKKSDCSSGKIQKRRTMGFSNSNSRGSMEENWRRKNKSEEIKENWDDPNQQKAAFKNPADSFVLKPEGKSECSSEKIQRRRTVGFSNSNARGSMEENWRRKNKSGVESKYVIRKEAESKDVGLIIGKGGLIVKTLEEKFNVKIKIEQDVETVIINIRGKEEDCLDCKREVDDMLNRKYYKPKTLMDLMEPEGTKTEPENSNFINWKEIFEESDKAEAERLAKAPQIKRNFYVECPEVANMTEEEVEKTRMSNHNTLVREVFGGDGNIPNPVKTFKQAFEPYPEILEEIKKQGFTHPSSIQCQAWPILLSGRDLIGISQTGSGKTLAYLLPALIHIHGQKPVEKPHKVCAPRLLILAPTRELALQLSGEVNKYSYNNIKSICVYGGASIKEQKSVLQQGADVIICTPGRLIDFLLRKVVDLYYVSFVVLDEADSMLDMGFEPQVRKILYEIRPDRQTVMTSATWPKKVEILAEKYMKTPVMVNIGSLDLTTVHSVSQTILLVQENNKIMVLLNFLRNLSKEDKVIVFVGRRKTANNLSCTLSLERIACDCFHGKKIQLDRELILEGFRSGVVKVLIATDVASRGLDIDGVTKIFNYDFPRNIEEYVHRVGRTGRAGAKGESISLFTRRDLCHASELIRILEEAEQPVPQDLYQLSKRCTNTSQRRIFRRG